MSVKEHIEILEQLGNVHAPYHVMGDFQREAIRWAVQLAKYARPVDDDAEREHCLTIARSWGLEGDRAHAQAQRLYEQRMEARAQGWNMRGENTALLADSRPQVTREELHLDPARVMDLALQQPVAITENGRVVMTICRSLPPLSGGEE